MSIGQIIQVVGGFNFFSAQTTVYLYCLSIHNIQITQSLIMVHGQLCLTKNCAIPIFFLYVNKMILFYFL